METYILGPSSGRALWLGKEYRTATATDAAVKEKHLLSPELNVDSLMVAEADAQAEADRLLALYKIRRDVLKVQVKTQVVAKVILGQVVKIVNPRYGYSAGKLFRVIGVVVNWGTGTVTLTLWG